MLDVRGDTTAYRRQDQKEASTPMTLGLSEEAPTAPTQQIDVLAEIDRLQAQIRWAECKVYNLERALLTSRQIGIAIGIVMCQHQVTDEQAFDLLRARSQHCHVKIRELAETVIYTGTL